jgi:hypothetical protein
MSSHLQMQHKRNQNPPHFHKHWNGVVWNKETVRVRNYKKL